MPHRLHERGANERFKEAAVVAARFVTWLGGFRLSSIPPFLLSNLQAPDVAQHHMIQSAISVSALIRESIKFEKMLFAAAAGEILRLVRSLESYQGSREASRGLHRDASRSGRLGAGRRGMEKEF